MKMKARFYTLLAMAFIAGAAIGIIGYRFSNDMRAYANVPQHCKQGRVILELIEDYKAAHGELPNQEWFSALGGGLTTTREGYHWFYFNPPRMRRHKDGLLISTAIENNHYYVEGFSDGTMSVSNLKDK
ncbi:MAG: hypothetical protein RI957_2042 [Verrucomicrobiota bacterium]|jgi:hypothetical protein